MIRSTHTIRSGPRRLLVCSGLLGKAVLQAYDAALGRKDACDSMDDNRGKSAPRYLSRRESESLTLERINNDR